METLHVRLFDRHVGELGIEGEVRSPEDWQFRYAPEYLDAARSVALSVSLPLRAEPFIGAAVRNWFGNLLPEGAVREAIAARLRIPVRDDFALLAGIGGECAGAVSIVPQEPPSAETQSDPATDLDALLAAMGDMAGEGTWALLGTPRRLSLAGAQDKIAVVREANGHLRLPAVGELTTHILKPESRRLPGLRDLEALGLALAAAIGLNAASAALVEVAGHKALLLERYDRHVEDGHLERLHQEDFCQALGYPGELKYEAGGGPSLAQCARLVRQQLRLGPVAVQAVLDWVTFNTIIGNADAHAKNLALLCGRDGRRRLAPFYDLVPTIAISERLVDRQPALRIGASKRIDNIGAEDLRGFAKDAGYAPGFVLKRVATVAEAVAAHADDVAQVLVKQGADRTHIERAAAIVRANAERLRRVST
ncbi:MAG TPA: type II toxin-antitoxin system HipA family toxin [Rhodanobacteraceae bacterium]|jgi:serine/threonine-protein kinase HipA|nr:type II toxin-antitoxin system HipA family toxin [Rhodanobacteraceae bacterium]